MSQPDASAPIPMPQVLDPHRVIAPERSAMTLEDHRDRAQQLEAALEASCDYGQQLWNTLTRLREYLVQSLPGDGRGTASPDGPNDDAGWNAWSNAYAAVTSVLTGKHGDEGLGQQEAQLISQHRRV